MEVPPFSSIAQINAPYSNLSVNEKRNYAKGITSLTSPNVFENSTARAIASSHTGNDIDFKLVDLARGFEMLEGQVMYPFRSKLDLEYSKVDPFFWNGSRGDPNINVNANLIGTPLGVSTLEDPRLTFVKNVLKLREFQGEENTSYDNYLKELLMTNTEKGSNYYYNQLEMLNQGLADYSRKKRSKNSDIPDIVFSKSNLKGELRRPPKGEVPLSSYTQERKKRIPIILESQSALSYRTPRAQRFNTIGKINHPINEHSSNIINTYNDNTESRSSDTAVNTSLSTSYSSSLNSRSNSQLNQTLSRNNQQGIIDLLIGNDDTARVNFDQYALTQTQVPFTDAEDDALLYTTGNSGIFSNLTTIKDQSQSNISQNIVSPNASVSIDNIIASTKSPNQTIIDPKGVPITTEIVRADSTSTPGKMVSLDDSTISPIISPLNQSNNSILNISLPPTPAIASSPKQLFPNTPEAHIVEVTGDGRRRKISTTPPDPTLLPFTNTESYLAEMRKKRTSTTPPDPSSFPDLNAGNRDQILQAMLQHRKRKDTTFEMTGVVAKRQDLNATLDMSLG